MNGNVGRRDEDIVAYSSYDMKKRRKRIIRAITVGVIALAVVSAVIYLFLTRLFVVETVIVDGTDTYSYLEICTTADIKTGSVIFFANEKAVNSALTAKFPYIRKAELEKQYPSTVNIVITEEVPRYYIEYDGEYFVITDEMKVLEKYTDKERMLVRFKNIKPVYIPDLYKAIVSYKLDFISDKDTRHVREVLKTLSEWENFDRITSLDMTNRFNIRMVYDERITVRFGNKSDLDDKIRFASGIISKYSDGAYGTIIVDSTEEAVARMTDPAMDRDDE